MVWKKFIKIKYLVCDDRNNDDSGINMAYKELDKCVHEELMKQQNYIWSCPKWRKKRFKRKACVRDSYDDLRQDVLIDGIKANRKQRNLYLIEADMSSSSDDIGTSNFNVFLEYNTKNIFSIFT